MVEINTKLSGDILEGLERFSKKIGGKILLSGVAATAFPIYEELLLNTSGVRPGMPKILTGTLHSAVYRAFSPERSTDDVKVYHVSVNHKKAPHWHLLEYGTSHSPAHPFIRPAFDRMGYAIERGKDRMTHLLSSGEFV